MGSCQRHYRSEKDLSIPCMWVNKFGSSKLIWSFVEAVANRRRMNAILKQNGINRLGGIVDRVWR